MARMKSKAVRLLLRWSETKPRLTAPDARDLQFMPESETWGAAVDRQQWTGSSQQTGEWNRRGENLFPSSIRQEFPTQKGIKGERLGKNSTLQK